MTDWQRDASPRLDALGHRRHKWVGRVSGVVAATGLVAVLVVLFIALPKGNKPTGNSETRGTSPQSPTALLTGPAELTGDGMRLELPAGWTGRLKLGGIRAGVQGELPVLQAGSFSLPIPDDDVGTGQNRHSRPRGSTSTFSRTARPRPPPTPPSGPRSLSK